jgi:hypothetical protein
MREKLKKTAEPPVAVASQGKKVRVKWKKPQNYP